MIIRLKKVCSLILASVIISASSFAANISKQELDLANKLTQGSAAEVEFGKLAQKRASTSEVKNFGLRMQKDHSILMNQVQRWAEQNNVAIVNKITEEDNTHLQKLSELSGSDFDKQYIQMMLKDHKTDTSELRNFVESAEKSSFKDLAVKTLPILENHLRVAENVAGRIGVPYALGLNDPVHPQT